MAPYVMILAVENIIIDEIDIGGVLDKVKQ